MQFQDRTDAGQWLGGELAIYAKCPQLLVLVVSPEGTQASLHLA